jgi:hypothetical protein
LWRYAEPTPENAEDALRVHLLEFPDWGIDEMLVAIAGFHVRRGLRRVEVQQREDDDYRWYVFLMGYGDGGVVSQAKCICASAPAECAISEARDEWLMFGVPWGLIDCRGVFIPLVGLTVRQAMKYIAKAAASRGTFVERHFYEED